MAKISGVMYAFFGFIAGLFMLVVSLLESRGAGMGVLNFGFIAPILMPVFYGAVGFVGGFISAGIYNLIARYVGGVRMEFAEDEPTHKE